MTNCHSHCKKFFCLIGSLAFALSVVIGILLTINQVNPSLMETIGLRSLFMYDKSLFGIILVVSVIIWLTLLLSCMMSCKKSKCCDEQKGSCDKSE